MAKSKRRVSKHKQSKKDKCNAGRRTVLRQHQLERIILDRIAKGEG